MERPIFLRAQFLRSFEPLSNPVLFSSSDLISSEIACSYPGQHFDFFACPRVFGAGSDAGLSNLTILAFAFARTGRDATGREAKEELRTTSGGFNGSSNTGFGSGSQRQDRQIWHRHHRGSANSAQSVQARSAHVYLQESPPQDR